MALPKTAQFSEESAITPYHSRKRKSSVTERDVSLDYKGEIRQHVLVWLLTQ